MGSARDETMIRCTKAPSFGHKIENITAEPRLNTLAVILGRNALSALAHPRWDIAMVERFFSKTTTRPSNKNGP
jgi:hypothetical protein